MKPSLAAITLGLLSLSAPAFAQTGFPFQDEALHYTVSFTSGLSLGEANLTAHRGAKGWTFEVGVDAAMAGFLIRDKYTSSAATADFCSLELRRDVSHGVKKTRETTTFDQKAGQAHRVTEYPEGGGSSDFDIVACPRDALAFVYFARKELGQGRVPPAQQVFFGSAYSVRMTYTGAQTVTVGEKKPEVTDHVTVVVNGPKSDFTVEINYARDAARTPLLIRIPQAVGTLSMELVR